MDLGEKLRQIIQKRVCQVCGAEFERIPATKDEEEKTALQQFSDHMITHQPTPEQWAKAYDKIQKSRLRNASS